MKCMGKDFIHFYMEVTRLSDSVDLLNITVSERLISNMDLSYWKRNSSIRTIKIL